MTAWILSRPRRNKYNARAVAMDGHKFASGAELKRYLILKDELRRGAIFNLELHPHFDFTVNGCKVGRGYTADYSYRRDGRLVVEEVKGFPAPDWPLRRDLFLALYDCELLVNGKAQRRRRA